MAVQLHTMFQMAADGTRQNAASNVAGFTAGLLAASLPSLTQA